MVVVKQGELPPPGKHYRVYLNADRKRNKWYLRVTHSFPHTNRHFRAGTYDSKEDALKAAETLDPIHPKKGRSKPGTVDRYSNGMWRVRVKYKGEHMHVGYYKDEAEAQIKLKEALNDPPYLEERYQSLLAKRRRKSYAKIEKRKRKYEDLDNFGDIRLAKRQFERQNIISPVTGEISPVLYVPQVSMPKTYSIEDYNAFLAAEQKERGGVNDFTSLLLKFKQQKLKEEQQQSFQQPFHSLKSELKSEQTPLEWCEFGSAQRVAYHGHTHFQQRAAFPTLPLPHHQHHHHHQHNLSVPKPPSFKATIKPQLNYTPNFAANLNLAHGMPTYSNQPESYRETTMPEDLYGLPSQPKKLFEDAVALKALAGFDNYASYLSQITQHQTGFPILPPSLQHPMTRCDLQFNEGILKNYSQMLLNGQMFPDM